jgi:DNA-binding transcriptional ArsR family regulator
MSRTAKALAPVFAALGDPIRLGVVNHLTTHGATSITGLTARTTVTRQAVTKHLRVLQKVRLVGSTKHGRERLWAVKPDAIADARRYLDGVAMQWDDALARLKDFVERA